ASWTSPAELKPATGDTTGHTGYDVTSLADERAALPDAAAANAASPDAEDATVLHHVKLAYSTLLRELENRAGELYLPLVERALNLGGQKDFGWVAIAKLLGGSPE